METLSRIEGFLEVAKQQSFAKAARKLGLTGPALSKQVQTLEEQLGVQLLHRTTRLVTLTEEGAMYQERARKAIEDLQEAARLVQDHKASPVGLLRINAPMSFGKRYLAQPLAAFAHTYPEVRLDVDFDDRNVDMLAEGYDVVIRIGALPDSSFIARKLAECPLILCATPYYCEKYGPITRPEELTSVPAITYTKHGYHDEWRYITQDAESGSVQLMRHFAANNAELMLEACLHHIGVAILPVFVASTYLQSGQLMQLLPDYTTYPPRNIYALFPEQRHLSTKTRLLIDWLTECSKAFPWKNGV